MSQVKILTFSLAIKTTEGKLAEMKARSGKNPNTTKGLLIDIILEIQKEFPGTAQSIAVDQIVSVLKGKTISEVPKDQRDQVRTYRRRFAMSLLNISKAVAADQPRRQGFEEANQLLEECMDDELQKIEELV